MPTAGPHLPLYVGLLSNMRTSDGQDVVMSINQHSAGPSVQAQPMSAGKAAWVMKGVRERFLQADLRTTRRLAERTKADRVDAVLQCYRDLWRLGYRLEKLESLAPRHVTALLAYWRSKELARATVQLRWSWLARWCEAISKQGMLPAFGDVWPEEASDGERAPEDESVEQPPRVKTLASLDEDVYRRLLAFLADKVDQTAYWAVRCVRELHLTREEALLLELAGAHVVDAPVILVWSRKGRGQRPVRLETHQDRQLVADLTAYLASKDKKRLGWPHMGVEELLARYANQVSYATRRVMELRDRGKTAPGMDENAGGEEGGQC